MEPTSKAILSHWTFGIDYAPTKLLSSLPKWTSTVVNWIHVRRRSSGTPKWWYGDLTKGLLEWSSNHLGLTLGQLFGRLITVQHTQGTAPTISLPYLDEERGLASNQRLLDHDPGHQRCSTRAFTRRVVDHFSPGNGLDCIIPEGLDGFACCWPRIRRFLQEQKPNLAFLILVRPGYDLTNIGLDVVDAILPDGGHAIFLHRDELLDPEPNGKASAILRAWDLKQNIKRDTNGDATLGHRNQV